MKGKSFFGEWRAILTDKHLLIPIIAVMLIPVLYAGMFLWAFWDPYDKLEDLPVAVVNEDSGATFEGEKLQLGDELVKNLKENKQFNFQFVDKEKGYKALENQEYYILVEIPKDFSKNATTILDETPKKLEMKYVPNEGYNFLSAQIGETAIEKIKAAVSEQITKTYSETIFEKIEEMADGFQSASDSANDLYEGLTKVNDGTTTIKENLVTLAEKQIEFKSGVDKVYEGVGKLSSGAQELSTGLGLLNQAQGQLQSGSTEVKVGLDKVTSGSGQLNAGMNSAYTNMAKFTNATEQLKNGASSLRAGLSQLNENAPALSQGAADLNKGLVALQNSLTPYLSALPEQSQQQLAGLLSQLVKGSQNLADKTSNLPASAKALYEGSQSLAAGLGEANQGAAALEQGMGQLNDASGELNKGLAQLQAGQSKVVAGMKEFGSKLGDASEGSKTLNEGLQTLSGGVTQLADGSGQLAEGASKLSDGANELSKGTTTAKDGSKEFKEALNDAADESSSVSADNKTFDMMAQPLEVQKEAVNHVPNYGTGFAPYFLSLGLFVGALLLSIVYPLFEPAVKPNSAFSWFFSKFGVLACVGVVQALIAAAIMLLGLKIEVQSVPLFILFSIISSLTYITLIQFFVTCFANPGRFVAIIILILQLTTSAGTFPLELIPKPLQWFNSFLPMTYTVKGYKAAITSGDFSVYWSNVGILAIFTLLFMAGTMYYFAFKYRRAYDNINNKEAANA